MKLTSLTAFAGIFSSLLLMSGQTAQAQSAKIDLSGKPITLITGSGVPDLLVDEQAFVGDPLAGDDIDPQTIWKQATGSPRRLHRAYIDLGDEYDITNVFLFDGAGKEVFNVYSGSPEAWNLIAGGPTDLYFNWKNYPVVTRTRYVMFENIEGYSQVHEVVLYGKKREPSFFVSTAGSDSNAGTLTAPFKTIAKAMSVAGSGDWVALRGGNYRETVSISKAGVLLKPYNGEKANVVGSDVVTGWTLHSGNIYVANMSLAPTQVFYNDARQHVAQYPDVGAPYLKTTGTSGTTYLRSSELSAIAGKDLVGANLYLRSALWKIEDKPIATFNNSDVLTWTAPNYYTPAKGFNFYLTNKLWMMKPGTWVYDAAQQKIYMWLADGTNPSAGRVEASVRDGIVVSNAANVTIEGVSITKTANLSVSITNSTEFKFLNNTITHSGGSGVVFTGTDATAEFVKNGIYNAINNGLVISRKSEGAIKITDNIIRNIGTIGSMRQSHAAIQADETSNVVIKNNVLEHAGYVGIRFYKNAIVEGNVVRYPCKVISDCGGIYTWTGAQTNGPMNSVVRNNIVSGAPDDPEFGEYNMGIYLDDQTSGVTVSGNTTFDNSGGIYFHNTYNNVVSNNVFYGNRHYQIHMSDVNSTIQGNPPGTMSNNQITNNVLVSMNDKPLIYIKAERAHTSFATFNHNIYSTLYSSVIVKEDSYPSYPTLTRQTNSYELPEWKVLRAQDLQSSITNTFIQNPFKVAVTEGNIVTNGDFLSSIAGWKVWSSDATAKALWSSNCPDLSSGCMSITTAGVYGAVTGPAFPLVQDKTYLFKMNIQGLSGVTPSSVVTVRVKETAVGGAILATSSPFPIMSEDRTLKFVFTAPKSAEVVLNLNLPAGHQYTLGNISVEAVTLTNDSPEKNTKILTNTSGLEAQLPCPDGATSSRCSQYVGVDRQPVVFPVTLPPYGSKVIIWTASSYRQNLADSIAPVIQLNGASSVNVEAKAVYIDAGATATDENEGDVSSKIVVVNPVNTSVLGTYRVTYDVKDSAGNAAAQASRNVTVRDTVKPVLTLSGDPSIQIDRGSVYVDAGATAQDAFEGNISSRITVDNAVLTSVVGTYSVIYNVKDSSGNYAAAISRQVNVVEPPPVYTNVAEGKPALASSTTASSPSSPAFAVDADSTTMWKSASDSREYTFLEIDLQGYKSIHQFDLEIGTTTGSAPANFEIQAQNQGCWKTVPGTVVSSNPSSEISKSFALTEPVITNKVRFVCKNSGGGCMVRSFEAIGLESSLASAPAPSCVTGVQVVRRAPSYDYAEFLPTGYNDGSKNFPVIIALHGIGGETLQADRTDVFRKDDETKTLGRSPEGVARQLEKSAFRATFPAVVVSPHCREVGIWESVDPNPNVAGTQTGAGASCWFKVPRLEKLLEDVMATYRVNKDQVYFMGLSGGGILTAQFSVLHHSKLAAIALMASDLGYVPGTQKAFDASGNPVPDVNGDHICNMRDMPVFASLGTMDTTILPAKTLEIESMMNVKCKPTNKKAMMRIFAGATHSGAVWDAVYADQRTYNWLFAQKLSDRAKPSTHVQPTASISPGSKYITLPVNTASFTGSGTTPGSIENYSWINSGAGSAGTWPKLAEGASVTFGPYSAAGVFKYRVIVTDSFGFSAFKETTVTVSGP